MAGGEVALPATFAGKLGRILLSAPHYHPSIRVIGCGVYWLGRNSFLCHAKTVSPMLHIRSNGLCADFRNHGFTTRSGGCFSKTLLDSRGWKIRSHELLDKENLEASLQQIRWIPPAEESEPPALERPPDPVRFDPFELEPTVEQITETAGSLYKPEEYPIPDPSSEVVVLDDFQKWFGDFW